MKTSRIADEDSVSKEIKYIHTYNKLLVNCFRYHSSSPKRKALLENEITRRAEYKADNEPSFTWQLFISEDNQQNSPEMYKSYIRVKFVQCWSLHSQH